MISPHQQLILHIRRPPQLSWDTIQPLLEYWPDGPPSTQQLTDLIDQVWPNIELAPEFGFQASVSHIKDPSHLLLWVFRRRSRDLDR